MPDPQSNLPSPYRSPAQFFAFGFGSGLAPRAPGTFGTLAAVPFYVLLAQLGPGLYSVALLITFVFGVWVCEAASRQLQVHDHPGIVWDEFVGYWITMFALPPDWVWILAGFVAFRVFDIVKPWPIGALDKRVGGGMGIMIDDVVAGAMACALLHSIRWWLG
ncbi:phosphatidylglycerophosphatase A family protein [Pseudohalioglobus lutimaris]|uniref:Phosphatidylglycerophosphatase A n=1 Tax=Pseudohalioglobus lutimaris TaxID=1737061 RepID=A0A2N5X2E0_9GAMM|nr:phosphatidylglycerophosphatase A [Pseudohalioglobus lutimaris]PLW68656.1 phosphatidylglycerophosphatase A [Pseudohalioglobus lutimaris]